MKDSTQKWLIFGGVMYLIYKMFDLSHKIEHLKRGQPDFHPTAFSEYLVQKMKEAEKGRGSSVPNNGIDKQINTLSAKIDELKNAPATVDNSEVLKEIKALSDKIDTLKAEKKKSVESETLKMVLSIENGKFKADVPDEFNKNEFALFVKDGDSLTSSVRSLSSVLSAEPQKGTTYVLGYGEKSWNYQPSGMQYLSNEVTA